MFSVGLATLSIATLSKAKTETSPFPFFEKKEYVCLLENIV